MLSGMAAWSPHPNLIPSHTDLGLGGLPRKHQEPDHPIARDRALGCIWATLERLPRVRRQINGRPILRVHYRSSDHPARLLAVVQRGMLVNLATVVTLVRQEELETIAVWIVVELRHELDRRLCRDMGKEFFHPGRDGDGFAQGRGLRSWMGG